ncbi:MAG TPA: phosphopyruvate hydratase [Candidatus Dojkabacteria bacterium]|nr:phosphopyruvate hydratase [Candidatus Dojkabacteria bacterium]HQF36218.1 phosphopyruvate hydratase [Candidatus Dojkabacteria bacterium]
MNIKNINAIEILDSNGFPTVEVTVVLDDGTVATGAVPSGASTGDAEAVEIRDNDPKRFSGKGVLTAVDNVNNVLKKYVLGKDAYEQEVVDKLLIEVDGTENKSKYGANAILPISMAICRASAKSQKMELFEYFGKLSGNSKFALPQPMILVMEGGKHGDWATDFQEYFVIPKRDRFGNFKESLRAGAEIFHALKKVLKGKGYDTGVGFEGAYCPKEIKSNSEVFDLIIEAVKVAGYYMNDEIVLGADMAASEFYQDGNYVLKSEGVKLTNKEWINKQLELYQRYPIWSIEDTLDQNSWEDWAELNRLVGDKMQIIGDDLLVTNVDKIKKGIELKSMNGVLIKLNQIGTVTQTVDAIKLAHSAGLQTIISHRGGETNDDMIADLCVGTGSGQSKFGGPDRGERVAKYNRLLKIESALIGA